MAKPTTKAAAIYTRVSTIEQVSNLSLTTQLEACRHYCETHGLTVDAEFTDRGESAKTTNRPQFLAMLEHCQKNKGRIDVVVVYNVSRFSRNTHDHLGVKAQLYKCGVALRSVTEPIDETAVGRLNENLMSVISQFDNDVKAERTKAGMTAALSIGRWTHRAPLGYLNGDTKAEQPSLILDPERAPLMRRAFELAAEHPLVDVLAEVTRLGLRTRKGREVAKQTLSAALRNPLYIGRINAPGFGVKDVQGDFEALIPEALFMRVQAALAGRAGPSLHNVRKNPDFPLRRFTRCECGTALTGSSSRGRTKQYSYYHCSECGVRVPREDLESQFVDLLESLQPTDEFLAVFRLNLLEKWKKRGAEAGRIQGNLKRKLIELESQQEKIAERLTLGDQNADVYERLLAKKRDQATQIRLEIENAKIEKFDIEGVLDFAERALCNAAHLWLVAVPEQKPRLQRAFFPNGLTFEGGKLRTDVTSSAFNLLASHSESVSGWVSPTGFEPVSQP